MKNKQDCAIDILFRAYLDGEFKTPKDKRLAEMREAADELRNGGLLSAYELTEFETAVGEAGFYAGFKAALDMIKHL